MAKYTEAQKESIRRYRNNTDMVYVTVPKGKKDEWKARASSEGKSLNRFIIDKVEGE